MKIKNSTLIQIKKRKEKEIKSKKTKSPTWFFPTSKEREYTKILWSYTNHLKDLVKEYLYPSIPQMVNQVKEATPERSDDYMDDLRRIINFIKTRMKPLQDQTILMASDIGYEIGKYNDSQFQKINQHTFGIDIFQDEPWLEDQLKLFANQNSQLIKSLEESELDRVAGIVERGLQQGERFEKISKEMQKSFGITHRRAKLIARDQTTKLNASLTKLRQQELGVDEYEWQTSGDERVRPSHRANDGKRFKWSQPPSLTGHPGHDINCRCVALPVLEGLLDIKMSHPNERRGEI